MIKRKRGENRAPYFYIKGQGFLGKSGGNLAKINCWKGRVITRGTFIIWHRVAAYISFGVFRAPSN